jgi:aspartate kinase
MIVMKFGGTSVQNSQAIGQVMKIVSGRLDRSPVVVVSAMAGVTDALIRAVRYAARGRLEEAVSIIEELRQRHLSCALDLLLGGRNEMALAEQRIQELMAEIETALRLIAGEGTASPRNQDLVVSQGERLSSTIVACCLSAAGLDARLVDSRDFVVTDDNFTCAGLDLGKTCNRTRDRLLPMVEIGDIPVAQGFIGATLDGRPTTIGRGGSDYSAAVIGAALGVEEIEIWTDVDGVMTADPRVVPGAELVTNLSFSEAAELAFFGTKVLHPSTVLPAIEQGIPVRIYNTYNPASEGTLITAQGQLTDRPVKSIAFKRNVEVLNVTSNQAVPRSRFLLEVFDTLYQNNASVALVNPLEQAVSVTIDQIDDIDATERALARLGSVTREPGKSLVCVVGQGIRGNPALSSRLMRVLGRATTGFTGHGSTPSSLTAVVDEHEVERSVRALHDELFVRTRASFRGVPPGVMREQPQFGLSNP